MKIFNENEDYMNWFNNKKEQEVKKNERSLQKRLHDLDPEYLEKLTTSFDLLQCNAQSVASEANNTAAYLQNELESTRYRFFTVIDHMVDLVIIKNAKGQWITANKFAQTLLNLKLSDFYMKTNEDIANIGHGNELAYLESAVQDSIAWETQSSIRYMHSFTDTNGTVKQFDMIKTPTYTNEGEPKELIIIGRDVTDIIKTQQLNKAVTSALQNASDIILIIDANGLITFCNTRFLNVFGYSRDEEVENHPISIVKSGKHDDKFYADLWSHLKENKTWHGEIINKHKNGSFIRCNTTVVPIMNGLPEPIYYISVMKIIN